MLKIFQSTWLSALIGGILFLATLVLFLKPRAEPKISVVGASASSTNHESTQLTLERPNPPSWDYKNPEVEDLVKELQTSKTQMAQRATQLDELAARLQSERFEINQVTQKVNQLQAEFDQKVIRVHEEEVSNLKKLAKTYTTMTIEGTTAIFKQLDDTAVVKILMYMKEVETAPILDALAKPTEADAKRVAGISEQLRLAIPDSRLSKRTKP